MTLRKTSAAVLTVAAVVGGMLAVLGTATLPAVVIALLVAAGLAGDA